MYHPQMENKGKCGSIAELGKEHCVERHRKGQVIQWLLCLHLAIKICLQESSGFCYDFPSGICLRAVMCGLDKPKSAGNQLFRKGAGGPGGHQVRHN